MGITGQDVSKAVLSAANNIAAANVSDAAEIFKESIYLLNFVTHRLRRADIIARIEKCQQVLQKKESLEQCNLNFDFLGSLQSSHYKSESAYGKACVHAVLGDAESAVQYLKTAIDLTRTSTGYSYRINQAKLDEDFDDIRSDSSFKELVSGEKSVAHA
jgi:hypothetical protein